MSFVRLTSKSDIILAVARVEASDPYNAEAIRLIHRLYKKIETVYKIIQILEEDETLKELGEKIRKALES